MSDAPKAPKGAIAVPAEALRGVRVVGMICPYCRTEEDLPDQAAIGRFLESHSTCRSELDRKKPKERLATCGACGTERLLSEWDRRRRETQFQRRDGHPTDLFYCGCQDEDFYD